MKQREKIATPIDICTLANHMNKINNEILDVKDTLKNTKEEVKRLEKCLKVVSAHKHCGPH